MKSNFKSKTPHRLFLLILLLAFLLINQAKIEALSMESLTASAKETENITRIVISASGSAEFNSYWLDDPPRLVVKFQSRNILSGIDNEVIVNQGAIKKITSSYFKGGQDRALRLLTFELTQKAPYKIWQEGNIIILDIQALLEAPAFFGGGKEIFAIGEGRDVVIKRLEAMDMTLAQVAESQTPLDRETYLTGQVLLETPKVDIAKEVETGIDEAEAEIALPALPKSKTLSVTEPLEVRKSMMGLMFWFSRLILISALGFLVWHRYRPDINQKIRKLKSQLKEKSNLLKQEEVVLEAIEKASLKKEKEFEQLKCYVDSLRGELEKKGLVKKQLSPEEKEKPWIPGSSQERRTPLRLPLTKDWTRTVILRVKSQDIPQGVKSFASDIGTGGLCFGTEREFKEKEPINLRLIFYGDIVPMIKIQAHIAWKKVDSSINYYGVAFDSLEEKDELELNRYIELKNR